MKKIYTTLVALALAVGHLAAQNWAPIAVGETHHFRLPGAKHITHTIRIDSFYTLPDGGAVFSLNRVLRRWTEEDSAYAWVNQGQFLGQTAERLADGCWRFSGLDKLGGWLEFTLIPTAGLGQSWASNGLTASVTAIALGEVLGQPDSVKTIQFSDGAMWLLSKSHGLLRCPDPFSGGQTVQLSGLETKQLGDRLYRFEDFFDYGVGDVFEISSSYCGLFGCEYEHSKNVVIEKDTVSNGWVYKMARIGKLSSNGLGGDKKWTVKDTAQWWIDPFNHPHVGAYANQEIPLGTHGKRITLARMVENGLRLGDSPNSFGDLAKDFFVPIGPDDDWYWLAGPDLWVSEATESFYEIEYRKGLGHVLLHSSFTDNWQFWALLGAVVQGDTVWGKISPDWLFTSTKTPGGADFSLRVAPNPAQDEAFVQIPETLENEQVVAQIFSAEGRLLRQQEAQPEGNALRLDLTGISPQTCWVTLRAQAGVWHGRVVKGR